MIQQIKLTSNVENFRVMESVHEINEQPVQTYRSPKVVELGKASELLQGGACYGLDGSSQTYCKP